MKKGFELSGASIIEYNSKSLFCCSEFAIPKFSKFGVTQKRIFLAISISFFEI